MHSQSSMLRELYTTAFPVNEQIPWDDLMWLIDQMSLDFTAYYDAGAGKVVKPANIIGQL